MSDADSPDRSTPAFIRLVDTLRPLGDPAEIQTAATRFLVEHLGVDRAAYGSMDPAERMMAVERDWMRPGVSSIIGRYHIDDFGVFYTSLLRAGRAAIVEDAANDPRIGPDLYAATWQTIGIRAAAAVPLVKHGRLVAAVFVHSAAPKSWSGEEIELLAEVGERTWGAVERAKAEAELHASEQRFRLMIDSVRDYAIFLMNPDGRIASWNEGAERILGYTTEEAIGQYGAILFTAEDRSSGLPERELETARREGRASDENWLVRKDGARFWASGVSTAMRNKAGLLQGFTKIFRDLSERRANEENLRRLNDALDERVREQTRQLREREERLRALNAQLVAAEDRERKHLATLLHDHVQQLLVAAKMQTGLMQKEAGERDRPHLDTIDALLDDALKATRSMAAELVPPFLHERGLSAALNSLATRMQERHDLLVVVTADERGDPGSDVLRELLYQLAQELLLNVVKHAKTDRAWVNLLRADGSVMLVVKDLGVGYDPNDPGDGATGLFNARRRLADVGGRLEIESTLGEGTRIKVTVPIEQPTAPQNPDPNSSADSEGVANVADRRLRVLIVDDHEIVRSGVASLLARDSTLEIVGEAVDGREGVELARRLRPDVVLMDINMPELNGIEATRRIKAEAPQIRVLIFTLQNHGDLRHMMRDAGADGYVAKDASTDEIVRAIRESVAT